MIIYRTDDATRWGIGKGSDLDPDEVDRNFWEVLSAIAVATDHMAELVVSIDYLTVTANTFTVTLTDHTVLGPYTLPQINWNFRGAWQPSTNYAVYDVFSINAQVYQVLVTHLSDTTFNPAATNGLGAQLYGLLLEIPGHVIPAGGHTGDILMKASDDDFDLRWFVLFIDDIADVQMLSPIDEGQVLTFDTGRWTNKDPSPGLVQVQTVSASVWTPTIADVGKYTRFTSSSPDGTLIQIAPSATFPAVIGSEIHGRQATDGFVTIVGLSGVTINPQDDCFNITSGQGATFTLKKVDTDEWDLFGRLLSGASGSGT